MRILSVGLLALLLASSLPAAEAPRDLHIFLLIGQSNMAGRGALSAERQLPVEGAWLWDGKTWVPAKPGFNRFSPHHKRNFTQGLNPGPSFVEAYRKAHPGVQVGIVCHARGGTSIEQWEKGRKKPWPLYDDAIAATRAAMKHGTLIGVLWHQGESNSGKAAGYPGPLNKLVASLRVDLKNGRLPIVYSQLGAWNKGYAKFNEMIVQQPARIPNTACVTTEGLKNRDSAHFSAEGQEELGRRYAAVLLKLINQNATP